MSKQLAEWWCQLNAWKWPDGLRTPENFVRERDLIQGAFAVVDTLASDEGTILWQERCRDGLDPATGMRPEDVPFVPSPGVKP